MKKEVSNKVVLIFLVLAVVSTVLGTYAVYENINDEKLEERDTFQIEKKSSSTGFVILEVTGNEEKEEK